MHTTLFSIPIFIILLNLFGSVKQARGKNCSGKLQSLDNGGYTWLQRDLTPE